MRNLLLILVVILGFASCKTATLGFEVMRPADINLPQHLEKIGVANRSIASKENKAGNLFEGLVTGEGIGVDRKGSISCVQGLVDFLSTSPRLSAVLVNDPELKGTGTEEMPYALPWPKVKEICSTYALEGLIVLEAFDSDSRQIIGKPEERTKTVNKKEVSYFVYPASLDVSVKAGWRIYDLKTKTIVDADFYVNDKSFSETANSEEAAVRGLPSLASAVESAALEAGSAYGFRVSPMWVRVNRTYYKGKYDELKEAHELVERGLMDEAFEIWKKAASSSDERLASWASYNMALAAEYQGLYELAIEWATKSKNMGLKNANAYLAVLKRRLEEQARLSNQLNE